MACCLAEARLAEATAMGRHEEARTALSKAENALATAEAELASATRESDAAAEEFRVVGEEGDRHTLDEALIEAQRDRATKLEALEKAREGARAFTLELLRSTLAAAADEASRTFLAPVTRRAAGYIGQLLPGCDLTFDEELGLASVTRAGIDESCGDLSKGTQEQLAILTRLAFADMLLEDGAPISLILDDPLVYSDDARLETMTDILQEASKRMQVILLTCRSKAFRHIDANRVAIV